MPSITLYEHVKRKLTKNADGEWELCREFGCGYEYEHVTRQDLKDRLKFLKKNTIKVKKKGKKTITRAASPFDTSKHPKPVITIKQKGDEFHIIWRFDKNRKNIETFKRVKTEFSDVKTARKRVKKIKQILSRDKFERCIHTCNHFDRIYISIIGYGDDKGSYEFWIEK